MNERALQAAVMPSRSELLDLAARTGCPPVIAEVLQLYSGLAEMMRQRPLSYLPLPPLIATLGEHPAYAEALLWGRGFYFDSLHMVDARGEVVRSPDPFPRAELPEVMKGHLFPDDLQMAAMIPLAWRVGVVVGFLSGLAVAQPDDAQNGMALLAALVAPLIVQGSRGPALPETKSRETKSRPVVTKLLAERARLGRRVPPRVQAEGVK